MAVLSQMIKRSLAGSLCLDGSTLVFNRQIDLSHDYDLDLVVVDFEFLADSPPTQLLPIVRVCASRKVALLVVCDGHVWPRRVGGATRRPPWLHLCREEELIEALEEFGVWAGQRKATQIL